MDLVEELLGFVMDAVEEEEVRHPCGWADKVYAAMGDHLLQAASQGSNEEKVVTRLRDRCQR